MHGQSHVSDENLILAIDNELDEEQAAEVQAHLAHCWTCRVRRGELEGAIAGYVQLHRSLAVQIPPGDGPAAKLRAQMALLTPRPEPSGIASSWLAACKRLPGPAFLCASVTLIAIAGLGWVSAQRASARPLPDTRLTPGATRLISRDQVCKLPADDDGLLVRSDLAVQVFKEYKIRTPGPRAYEVDFLISPALGGADDIRNLWPQPYAQGVWNSRVKDALEDHLRRLVCEGKVDLATAQHEIASDWIAAYRKYFRTGKPLAAHALFVKDRPWE